MQPACGTIAPSRKHTPTQIVIASPLDGAAFCTVLSGFIDEPYGPDSMTVTEPEATHDGPTTLTKRQVNLAIGAVLMGMVLSSLDSTIVNTALLTIVDDIGGLKSYTWVAVSYLLTSTPAMALSGKLSDIFGRLRIFQVGIITFLIGSTLAGFAQTMGQLVGARAIQGIGGGAMGAMVFAVIGDLVSPRERGRYSGPTTSAWAVASLVGPVLGGLFVDHLNWRWIFWVNIPIGLASLVVATKVLSGIAFNPVRQKIDLAGAAWLTTAVTAFVLAVSWSADDSGWSSANTIGLLATSAVFTTVFIWWEGRVAEPFVPLRLFTVPTFRLCVIMGAAASMALFAVNAFMPLFFQAVTGVSPTSSGLLLAPIIIGLVAGATYSGRRTAITGHYRHWVLFGTTAIVVGTALLALLDDNAVGVTAALVGMAITGVGMGTSNPTATTATQNAVELRDLGVGTSMLMFFRTLASVVGLAVFGTLFNSHIHGRLSDDLIRSPRSIRDLPEPVRSNALQVMTDGIRLTFLVSLPVLIIGVIAARALRELPLRATASTTEQSPTPLAGH